jgi:CBS-domain-containing membrane protein
LRGYVDRDLVRRQEIDQMDRLKELWKSYLWQCACATVAVLVVLLIVNLQQAVVISSIGATTFIVFIKPGNTFATPRSIVGGHVVGVLVGSAFALVPHPTSLTTSVVYALAVGLALFLMAVTDTEHPPAAGTALGVLLAGEAWWRAAIAILTSAVLLALFHHLLRPYLRDL